MKDLTQLDNTSVIDRLGTTTARAACLFGALLATIFDTISPLRLGWGFVLMTLLTIAFILWQLVESVRAEDELKKRLPW